MLDAQKKLNSILDQINRLNAISDAKASKFWYSEYSRYRNVFSKELNLAEAVTIKGLKKSPLCTLNHPASRTLLNTLKGYNLSVAQYNIEDSYLKKRIGEAVNNKKITTK
jgi:hypothetical protein